MDKLERTSESSPVKSRNEMLSDLVTSGICPSLPFELDLLKAEFEALVAEQDNNGALLGQAMQDSSDTWHDNAAAEIINAASIGLSTKARQTIKSLREMVTVEYPSAEVEEVTLGSVVYLSFGPDTPEPMLITGVATSLPAAYADRLPDNCEVVTMGSPLGSALIGAAPGDQVPYSVNGRVLYVTVTSLSQLRLDSPST